MFNASEQSSDVIEFSENESRYIEIMRLTVSGSIARMYSATVPISIHDVPIDWHW